MSDNISVLSHYTTSGSTNVSDQIDFDNINLSFNGCGFLGIYHVGVASALQYYLPNMNVKNICGASAGAWGAAAFIAGMPLGNYTNYVDNLKLVIIRFNLMLSEVKTINLSIVVHRILRSFGITHI